MKYADAAAYALSLPESAEAPHFNYASFRVRGRIFATVPPDQAHLHVFVDEEQRARALALYPDAAEPLHWGRKVVGLRVALAKARSPFVRELLRQAWTARAPKALLNASPAR